MNEYTEAILPEIPVTEETRLPIDSIDDTAEEGTDDSGDVNLPAN